MDFIFTPPVSWRFLRQRLIVGTDTLKTSATSFIDMPRSIAASTLSLRSLEYGLTGHAHRKGICCSSCSPQLAAHRCFQTVVA